MPLFSPCSSHGLRWPCWSLHAPLLSLLLTLVPLCLCPLICNYRTISQLREYSFVGTVSSAMTWDVNCMILGMALSHSFGVFEPNTKLNPDTILYDDFSKLMLHFGSIDFCRYFSMCTHTQKLLSLPQINQLLKLY